MKAVHKILVAVAMALAGIAFVVFNLYYSRSDILAVDVERIRRRAVTAVVSASGTVEPQRSVDISSSVMGRVNRLAVGEGDRVVMGQFLLKIDPESLQAVVDSGVASMRAAEFGLAQARVAVETAGVNLGRAVETFARQQELWALRLVSRDEYDQARRDVALRETELRARIAEVAAAEQLVRQEQAALDGAEYELSQVTITAPIDGVVARLSIEAGETVVIGTMNNPGTVLMTIADFSVLEAHLEVDETDIPSVRRGQSAAVAVDALPDRSYHGVVTEIGNSPIQDSVTGSQAINFRVVVTLDGDIRGVRSGFTATADITTATRTDVVAVPIQSTIVREVSRGRAGRVASAASPLAGAERGEPDPEEVEGVFVVREERAVFVRVETGIAGDRYFEALSGLAVGDLVVTGPFDVVRTLADGDLVRTNERSAGL